MGRGDWTRTSDPLLPNLPTRSELERGDRPFRNGFRRRRCSGSWSGGRRDRDRLVRCADGVDHLGGGDRAAEQEALARTDPESLDELELGNRLDALRDNSHVDRGEQAGDSLQRLPLAGLGDSRDEGSVDLDDVDGEAIEVAQ